MNYVIEYVYMWMSNLIIDSCFVCVYLNMSVPIVVVCVFVFSLYD